jgi:hypothetical protein
VGPLRRNAPAVATLAKKRNVSSWPDFLRKHRNESTPTGVGSLAGFALRSLEKDLQGQLGITGLAGADAGSSVRGV